jgi:hypothetical protein
MWYEWRVETHIKGKEHRKNLAWYENAQKYKNYSAAPTVKTTLETSGDDRKLHSKRVETIENYTRNEWGRPKITLETSGEDARFCIKVYLG